MRVVVVGERAVRAGFAGVGAGVWNGVAGACDTRAADKRFTGLACRTAVSVVIWNLLGGA